MQIFGVDIGGSGIKGAPVDLERGDLAQERFKVLTPQPATPDAVAEGVKQVVDNFGGRCDRVGITFPGVVTGGSTIRTAANVDKSWIDGDARALLGAEMQFGAGQGRKGTVMLLTFGTGIGSALFSDGVLVPNTELGHLELDGHDAESRAAASVRDEHGMSYKAWADRVNHYMQHVERLFTPDLFVVGGGISKNADKWVPLLELHT